MKRIVGEGCKGPEHEKTSVGREERDPGGSGKEASLGLEQTACSVRPCNITLRIWPRLQGKVGATVGLWGHGHLRCDVAFLASLLRMDGKIQ